MARKLKKVQSAYKIPASMSPGQASPFKSVPIPDRIGDSWRKNPTGRSPYSSMAVPNSGGRYDNARRSGLRNGVEGTEDPQRLPKLQGRRRKGNRYYRTD